ncbi:hypothetical protein E2562_010507 [Oryza meyeriana var. granulata]|uniref:Uncharacterized protein n=1 Tax=Oryza meyeriana var. granulata TaxID=110450 RepID=A0A6G1DUY1_9ORYZ|nr:hypothetical protein E2562_010507 [Oryza meyeriana var. granulata]
MSLPFPVAQPPQPVRRCFTNSATTKEKPGRATTSDHLGIPRCGVTSLPRNQAVGLAVPSYPLRPIASPPFRPGDANQATLSHRQHGHHRARSQPTRECHASP